MAKKRKVRQIYRQLVRNEAVEALEEHIKLIRQGIELIEHEARFEFVSKEYGLILLDKYTGYLEDTLTKARHARRMLAASK